jgi:hypothetical protein
MHTDFLPLFENAALLREILTWRREDSRQVQDLTITEFLPLFENAALLREIITWGGENSR